MSKKLLLSGVLAGVFLFGSAVQAEVTPDNTTVDGTATYLSTGAIVPTKVDVAGYDVREGKMHLNLTFESAPTTGSLPQSLPYSIEVLDHNTETTLLNEPVTETLTTDGTISKANENIEVTVPTLTAGYRVIIEVAKDKVK